MLISRSINPLNEHRVNEHRARLQSGDTGQAIRRGLVAVLLVAGSLAASPSKAEADCLPWQRDCNGTAMNGGTVDGYGHTWSQNLGGGYHDENGRTWTQDMSNNWVRSDGYAVRKNMGGGYTDSNGQNFNQTLGGTWQGDHGSGCAQQVSGKWVCQ